MGDWFQTVADVEATEQDADRLAASVLAWLIERGIVVAEQTDCVLDGVGYAPGANYRAAVTEPCAHIHSRQVNGLNVITGRTVFYSMGVDQIACPGCSEVVVDDDDDERWSNFSAAIDGWYAGGSGVQTCLHCRKSVGLNDWYWSPPWGFGYLGFEFWNWPPLDPSFITEVSSLLGHRTVTPRGKL